MPDNERIKFATRQQFYAAAREMHLVDGLSKKSLNEYVNFFAKMGSRFPPPELVLDVLEFLPRNADLTQEEMKLYMENQEKVTYLNAISQALISLLALSIAAQEQ
jgi:hypothetical protein